MHFTELGVELDNENQNLQIHLAWDTELQAWWAGQGNTSSIYASMGREGGKVVQDTERQGAQRTVNPSPGQLS